MSSRSTRSKKSITLKAAQIAVSAPQVVAHRVAQMAMAGPAPSELDRKEFNRMVAEKQTAFAQSWQEMAAQSVRANQALAISFMRAALSSWWLWSRPSASRAAAQVQSAALGILDKGMAPVHRTAVANAKRLTRTRSR